MPECPKCHNSELIQERIVWNVTKETVDLARCAKCGAIVDMDIERPKGMTLKNEHSAADIRFSENEKRFFVTSLLELIEQQNRILIAIATGEVPEYLRELGAVPPIGDRRALQTCLEMDDLDYNAERK